MRSAARALVGSSVRAARPVVRAHAAAGMPHWSGGASGMPWLRGLATGISHRADARPGGGPDKSKWKADVKIDNAAAVAKVRAKAMEGDVTSQYTLGAALMRGQLGLQKNTKEAGEWLLKAAEGGNVHAQFSFALLLSEGDGVPRDMGKAVHYWTQCAEAGLAVAQYRLGCCYEKGDGVPQDMEAAAILFARAVAQQHEQSRCRRLPLFAFSPSHTCSVPLTSHPPRELAASSLHCATSAAAA